MDPDQTRRDALEQLQARLLRVEQILHGSSDTTEAAATPAIVTINDLERRFAALVTNNRVYEDLLKTYSAHPSLFQSPPANVPPSQLDTDELKATVLSYATAFPSTASALGAAVNDMPVPDAALSAQLVDLVPRMQKIEQVQRDQAAEIAELRRRSEYLVRRYYEQQALASAEGVADVETRFERAEARVRRIEKARQAEAEAV